MSAPQISQGSDLSLINRVKLSKDASEVTGPRAPRKKTNCIRLTNTAARMQVFSPRFAGEQWDARSVIGEKNILHPSEGPRALRCWLSWAVPAWLAVGATLACRAPMGRRLQGHWHHRSETLG